MKRGLLFNALEVLYFEQSKSIENRLNLVDKIKEYIELSDT